MGDLIGKLMDAAVAFYGPWIMQFNALMQDSFVLYVGITFVVGLALLYFGLSIYMIVIGLQGLLVGIIAGSVLGEGHWLALLAGAILGFVLAIALYRVWIFVGAAFLIGAGAFAVMDGDMNQDARAVIAIVIGLIAGAVALYLHDLFIIISSAFTGAALVEYCGRMLWFVFVVGEPTYKLPSLFGFLEHLFVAIFRDGFERGLALAAGEIALIVILALSGIGFQLAMRKGEKKEKKPEPSSETEVT